MDVILFFLLFTFGGSTIPRYFFSPEQTLLLTTLFFSLGAISHSSRENLYFNDLGLFSLCAGFSSPSLTAPQHQCLPVVSMSKSLFPPQILLFFFPPLTKTVLPGTYPEIQFLILSEMSYPPDELMVSRKCPATLQRE